MKFLSRKRRAVALYPMSLIFISLLMLTAPGMLYNNFKNSGLAPAQVLGTAGVCGSFAPGAPIDVTCQGSVAAGCQANATACTLNNGVSFFNAQSPFTAITSGNIFALANPVTSNSNVNRGPFDANGGGQFYHASCYFEGVQSSSNNMTLNGFWATLHSCTQTSSDNQNITTKANTVSFTNWNVNATIFSTTLNPIHLFNIANNATFATICSVQGYWFVTAQPTVGYAVAGCDFFGTATGYNPSLGAGDNPAKTPIWSFLVALPCSASVPLGTCKAGMPSAANPGANYHLNTLIQPQSWDTAFCPNTFPATTVQIQIWYSSQQCNNEQTWYTTPHTAGGFGTSGNFNFGFFTPFLTILLGLVLFLIGTGINVRAGGSIFGSGTQFGIGNNRQGTKLAQILGLALIVWTFLYSQFSTWFTSGVLPNGFDGTLGITSIVISGIFFGGVMWQATQD